MEQNLSIPSFKNDSERARRDSCLLDMLSTKREPLQTISELLSPNCSPFEETLPQRRHVSVVSEVSPSVARGMWRKFSFSPPATQGTQRPRRTSFPEDFSPIERARLRSLSHRLSLSLSPNPLVSERMIRMQVLEKYLSRDDTNLVTSAAVPSSSFFKIDFHNYLIDELKMSQTTGCHWLYLYLHILFKYTGLKHIALSLLLVGYALLGGVIFENLEYSNERNTTLNTGANVLAEITAFAASLNRSSEPLNHSQVELTAQLTEFYKRTIAVEGFVSSLDKLKDKDAIWTFGTATFYAMTLISTIGYGTIACKTTWGRVVTVIYVTIGLPLMLVVLRDIGRMLFFTFQKTYNRCHKTRFVIYVVLYSHGFVSLLPLYRSHFRKIAPKDESEADPEQLTFPLTLAVLLVYVYLMIVTLVVFFFDEEEATAGSSGLSLGNCFYFAFISLTTIGLGDVMPNNIHYSPYFAGLFLSGLALISVVNTATYASIERKYFNAMSALEHVLHELELEKKRKHDRAQLKRVHSKPTIFQELSNVVRLAALVIPNLEQSDLDENATNSSEITVENRKSSSTSLETSSRSVNVNVICRHISLQNSMRKKFEMSTSLVGGSRSNSAPTLIANAAAESSPPRISIVADKQIKNFPKRSRSVSHDVDTKNIMMG